MITRRRGPGDRIPGSAPTRMRPTRVEGDPYTQRGGAHYVGVETRNGLPWRPYRWRGRPVGNCEGGPMPCQRCELARGCGGILGGR